MTELEQLEQKLTMALNSAESNRAELERRLIELVQLAAANAFTVEVQRVSIAPLAMGNFNYQVNVGPTRPHYQYLMILEARIKELKENADA